MMCCVGSKTKLEDKAWNNTRNSFKEWRYLVYFIAYLCKQWSTHKNITLYAPALFLKEKAINYLKQLSPGLS